IQDDQLRQAAPPGSTTDTLDEARPWGKLCQQDGCGHIHTGLDHLRRNDNAIGAGAAGLAIQKLGSPALTVSRTETTVNETKLGFFEPLILLEEVVYVHR